MNQAVVGVGSNIEPEKHIDEARLILKKEQTFLKESSFIKTKPIGYEEQPYFINGAFLIESPYTYEELKSYLKDIENRLGRVRTANKYGPRTIDLDIVVWNGIIVDDDYYRRNFLKKAVQEILPELRYKT